MFETTRKKFPLALDLQTFAEGGAGGDGGNAPASDPASATSNQPTPGWGLPPSTDGQAAPAVNPLLADPAPAAPAAPEPAVFDFAGRKIQVSDPAIAEALKAVHGDYTKLTGTFTQTNQRLKELETQNKTYQDIIQKFPQAASQTAPPPAAPPEPQKSPEEMAQEFMDKFYENPQAALEGFFQQMFEKSFEQKVKPVIEPVAQIAEERKMADSINQLRQKYPDGFEQMVPAMQEVLNEMPQLLGQGLETVYLVAKGRAAQTPPPAAPTPEQLLADPNFVQQHILGNQEIMSKAVSQYLQYVQGKQQQAPTVMGGQPGGQAPSVPEARPKTLRDASKALMESWGLKQT